MTATTDSRPAGSPATASRFSFATSEAFKTFALVFAIATTVLYVICEQANWPLLTYHPATGRIDLGWAAARKNEGPAMYWYGWTATTLLGAGLLGCLATMLPASITQRIPLSLTWIVPIAAVVVLIYSLRFFWRW